MIATIYSDSALQNISHTAKGIFSFCGTIAAVAATVKANVQEQPDDIEENVNRIFLEGEHARSVDEAIGLLR